MKRKRKIFSQTKVFLQKTYIKNKERQEEYVNMTTLWAKEKQKRKIVRYKKEEK